MPVCNLPLIAKGLLQLLDCPACHAVRIRQGLYRQCLHDGHRLAIDGLPRAGLVVVHQVRHFGRVGLVVIVHIAPSVPGNGETGTVGSPFVPLVGTRIIFDAVKTLIGFGGVAAIIDTGEMPGASVAPSDDFTCKRISGIVRDDQAIETAVLHIHLGKV